MTAKLIIVIGILLIAYALYGTVQKARGNAKSSCCKVTGFEQAEK